MMSILALFLGWGLARTLRIVPATRDEPFGPGGVPPSPTPGTPSTPTTPGNGRRSPRTSRRPTVPAATTRPATSTTAPPWPQLMPQGLPPFPSGWVPYEPPPPAVVQRANELLPLLWQGGAGTFKVEKTAGVWVYYRATQMGEKRGVVAFKERPGAAAPSPAGPIVVTPQGPAVVPASSSSLALPTLRRGSSGSDVITLQRRLGLTADGKFGPATEAAVIAFQKRNPPLIADGIVGTQTWAVLMARAA